MQVICVASFPGFSHHPFLHTGKEWKLALGARPVHMLMWFRSADYGDLVKIPL